MATQFDVVRAQIGLKVNKALAGALDELKATLGDRPAGNLRVEVAGAVGVALPAV